MIAHWDSIRDVPAGLGEPGGINGQVQYNNSGFFGGASGFVNDDATGFVGVGTETPYYPLHIQSNSEGIFSASIDNFAEAGWGLGIWIADTSSFHSAIEIYNGGIMNFVVRNSGKVGIGVDPTCKLDVAGKTKTNDFQMTNGASNGFVLQSDASGNASWVNPTTISDGDWTIDGDNMYSGVSGNVGIGTTTPNRMLTISGTTPELQFADTDTITRWHIGQNSGSFNITETGVLNRMTFRPGGNVGIGIDTPTEKLDVVGNGSFTGRVSGADAVDDDEFVTKGQITYEVGDFAQGGVVFWVDETGQHGLVCAKEDQSSGVRWYAGTYGVTRATGDGPFSGELNTAIIISSQVSIGDDGNDYAAQICNDLQITEGGKTYGDWYLPSKEELDLMFQNKATIDATATSNGGSAFASAVYWSSTEDSSNNAWYQHLNLGNQISNNKIFTVRVRAVRAF